MTSSSPFESSKLTPCENTPLGGVTFGGPVVSQDKKKSSRSFFQVIVPLLLVCLGFTVYARLSSLASSSSVVNQSISKSVKQVQNENGSYVFPTASLVESETKTDVQEVTQRATTTELSEEGSTQYLLQFPTGVYDKSMNTNPKELGLLTNRCNIYVANNKDKSDDPSYKAEVLACQIYQNTKIVPIVLGTFKTGADMLQKATDMSTISSSDVSSLFVDHALAAMIDRGCFYWNNQYIAGHYSKTQYYGESNYKSTYSTKTGLSGSGSGRYSDPFVDVSVEAGYEQFHEDLGGIKGKTETAYGQKQYTAQVGELENVCFTKSRFDAIKDLVKPKWVKCWNEIRERGRYRTTIADLLGLNDRNCFKNVVEGGFFMPLKYIYSVGTKTTLSTSFTSNEVIEESGARNALRAGLEVTAGENGGSITAAISKEVARSKSDSSFEGHVNQEAKSFGIGETTCLDNGTCSHVIATVANNTQQNYQLLGPPSSLGKEYVSLDEILKLFFDDGYGLPDQFLPAYNQYEISLPGTVCWAYELHELGIYLHAHLFENRQNCWTHNEDIIPTGIEKIANWNSVGELFKMSGGQVSPTPGSCCNPCKSTRFCDAECRKGEGALFKPQIVNTMGFVVVHGAGAYLKNKQTCSIQ